MMTRALICSFAAAGLLTVAAAPASALTVQSGPLPAAASVYIANQQEMGRRVNLSQFAGDAGSQPLPRHMAETLPASVDDGSRYAADPVAFMARADANAIAACPASAAASAATPSSGCR